jgi:hypothetical protein
MIFLRTTNDVGTENWTAFEAVFPEKFIFRHHYAIPLS